VDVSYTLHEIRFEWDKRKAETNLRKHKVSFESACEAFFDPFLRVVESGGAEGERRQAVIGMTEQWRLLYVVYIENENSIRIISARAAKKPERQFYEEQ